MEARLSETRQKAASEKPAVAAKTEVANSVPAETAEAVAAVDDRRNESESGNAGEVADAGDLGGHRPPLQDEGEAPSFDATAEAAFLAEARSRGEAVTSTRVAVDSVEEVADNRALPTLDELVKRIPSEVRETLDELFRAKFVGVRRVPAKALKQ